MAKPLAKLLSMLTPKRRWAQFSLATLLLFLAGKGHGWGDFWKSNEDITAFADWFDRHLKQNAQ